MKIFTDRRALHQIPELDRQLPETMQYLKTGLQHTRSQVFSPMEGALCAWFDFGAERTVAFRSDADALPITERSQKPYASRHAGRMHACGHDGHMAILLELARRLDKKEKLNNNILLVFQPGEETTGGARDLCNTGIFDQYGAEAIFGLHIWPGLEEGVIFSRKNEMMSRSCQVKVDIYGKTAHIARSREGADALAAGVEFYRRVTAMDAALPKGVFHLIKYGLFHSGRLCNALSDYTHMEGSLRAFQEEIFSSLRAGILTAAKETERSSGCRVKVSMNEGYPAVMNPEELYRRVKKQVDFAELETPSMMTEDFSWYQNTLPGLFFFLGAGDVPPLHSDHFDFSEEILVKGADFFERLAESYGSTPCK